jgi:uncharacterized membrane protein YfhO
MNIEAYCQHTKVFAKTKVQFGYLGLESSYSVVIVHPKWNLILFVRAGEESAVIAYNMDSRKVHVIPYTLHSVW